MQMSRTNESEVLGERMNCRVGDTQARSIADAVARRSYGKFVAFLAARTRDVAAAEDALSVAFAAALADWPLHGYPSKPEGWLLTVARRKMMDLTRRRRTSETATAELQVLAERAAAAAAEIPDRRLALMFVCARPAVEAGIRAVDAASGAGPGCEGNSPPRFSCLRRPWATDSYAPRTRSDRPAFPLVSREREELPDRLDTVLDAIYAAFAEGWTDPGGTDVSRRDLTEEAIFLARLLTELLQQEPEALGLLAVMLHAEARRRARRNGDGEYVPLANQDFDHEIQMPMSWVCYLCTRLHRRKRKKTRQVVVASDEQT